MKININVEMAEKEEKCVQVNVRGVFKMKIV